MPKSIHVISYKNYVRVLYLDEIRIFVTRLKLADIKKNKMLFFRYLQLG